MVIPKNTALMAEANTIFAPLGITFIDCEGPMPSLPEERGQAWVFWRDDPTRPRENGSRGLVVHVTDNEMDRIDSAVGLETLIIEKIKDEAETIRHAGHTAAIKARSAP